MKTESTKPDAPEPPKFVRHVWNGEEQKAERRQIIACGCLPGQGVARTAAKHAVCRNCGGAVLTPNERRYVAALSHS